MLEVIRQIKNILCNSLWVFTMNHTILGTIFRSSFVVYPCIDPCLIWYLFMVSNDVIKNLEFSL